MSDQDYPNSTESNPSRGGSAAAEGTVQTASPESSADAEAVRQAKAEIQSLVHEIAELSRSEVEIDEFYEALLNKVVQALAAVGGAVWLLSESGVLQLQYQINLRGTGLTDDQVAQAQHGRLLGQVLKSTEATLVAPHSGAGGAAVGDENAPANPTDHLLVMAPVNNDQGPQGVVEVFQRTGARLATQRGYLRFLEQMCELAGDFLKSRRLRQFTDKQSLWERLESFTRAAHLTLDVRSASYTIANEGRRLIGCDRVTVAVNRAGRCRIEAVSGQDLFDKRANVIALLTRLANAVTATGEDLWYTGDTTDLAPQVEDALDAYVDESHAKAVAVLPLMRPYDEEEARAEGEHQLRPSDNVGALIVEQMVDSRPPEGLVQRVDVVRQHSATALANALEHDTLFLMPVWKTIGKAKWLVRAKTLPKTVTVTAAVLLFILWACVWPWDFELKGDGKLWPKERQFVFAQIDSNVDVLHVHHTQQVLKNAPLVGLRSPDLEKQITLAMGELDSVIEEINGIRDQLSNRDANLTTGDELKLQTSLAAALKTEAAYRKKMNVLSDQRAFLKVTSPIEGEVVTFDVDQKLQVGRPLRWGDILMEIARTDGDWEIELFLSEHRMGHIVEAQQKLDQRKRDGQADENEKISVSFILATHPEEEFLGWIEEIATTAEIRGEEGNTVKIRVGFDQSLRENEAFQKGIRPGAGVTAKIDCGKRSVGYVVLHDLIGWVQSNVFFRF